MREAPFTLSPISSFPENRHPELYRKRNTAPGLKSSFIPRNAPACDLPKENHFGAKRMQQLEKPDRTYHCSQEGGGGGSARVLLPEPRAGVTPKGFLEDVYGLSALRLYAHSASPVQLIKVRSKERNMFSMNRVLCKTIFLLLQIAKPFSSTQTRR